MRALSSKLVFFQKKVQFSNPFFENRHFKIVQNGKMKFQIEKKNEKKK